MTEEHLNKILAEFFLDSCREDAADVDNWCIQGVDSIDDIVDAIQLHLNINI